MVVKGARVYNGLPRIILAAVVGGLVGGSAVALSRRNDVTAACHKASGTPYLRPMIPTAAAQSIINFDRAATWPQ